jgi:hypothetical protein
MGFAPQRCRRYACSRGFGQIAEYQLGILRVVPDLSDNGTQWMRVRNHVNGPVRA